MALDMQTALSQYGFIGTLASSIPELQSILTTAAAQEWDPNRFQQAVEDSQWWKSNADRVRQFAILQATDPATYNQNVANAVDKVALIARSMGRSGDWNSLGLQALLNNWDEQQIRERVSVWMPNTPLSDGAAYGQAGELQGQLKELAGKYGVPATPQFISDAVTRIQAGVDTIGGFENIIKARAKATYPQFADQIDAGMTTRDIADPWIATMANTLELSSSQINLTDPLIQKALTQRNQDGVASSMPLWQFERSLKDDPRWDYTKQARQQATSTLMQIGRDFGMVGGA